MSDYSSAIQTCPYTEAIVSEEEKVIECYFLNVGVNKVGSNRSTSLVIKEGNEQINHIYEVVSGHSTNKSTILIQTETIVTTNCDTHTNQVIEVRYPPPDLPIYNANLNNQIEVVFDYVRNPFSTNPTIYPVEINACQVPARRISIKVYPDRKFSIEVKGKLSTNTSSNGKGVLDDSADASLSFKVSADWDKNKKGYINGELKKELIVAKKATWTTKVGGEWGERDGEINFKKYKSWCELLKSIYEGKLIFDSALSSEFFEGHKTKTWGLKFSMDCYVQYNQYFEEDAESFLVGEVSEISLGGTFLKFEWSYDLTSKFLRLFGWFGLILDAVRKKLEDLKLASLIVKISINNEWTLKNINFKTIKYSDGTIVKKKPNEAELETLINVEFVIEGKIRIDNKIIGADLKTESGIQCVFSSNSGTKITFTGLTVVASVFYESSTAYTSSKSPPKDALPNSKDAERNSKITIDKSKPIEIMREKRLC